MAIVLDDCATCRRSILCPENTVAERQLQLIAGVHTPLMRARGAPLQNLSIASTHLAELVETVQVHAETESSSGNHLSLDTSIDSGTRLSCSSTVSPRLTMWGTLRLLPALNQPVISATLSTLQGWGYTLRDKATEHGMLNHRAIHYVHPT